jgi:hypothetical protein
VAGEAKAGYLVLTYEADSRMYSINPDTGASTLIGATGVGFLSDLAITPSGSLYASSLEALYSVNPTTAATTLIGSFGSDMSMVGMVGMPNNTLYGIGQSGGGFYSINTTSGAATELFSTPFSYTGDLAHSSGSIFYATATFSDGSHLVRIDENAKSATDLGSIANGLFFAGMDFDPTGRLIAFATNGGVYDISHYTSSGAGTLLSDTGISMIGSATFLPAIAVPEPASFTLLGLGCVVLIGSSRWRSSNQR